MDEQNNSQSPSYSVIINVMGVIVLLVVAFMVIIPSCMPHRHSPRASGCQANLKQIGNSLKMYLSDWDETYPTNRPFTANHKLGSVSSYVKLSAVGYDKVTTKPYKFQHGVNWVEGLYSYMEGIVARNDSSSVWKCPSASLSAKSKSAEVSYAFNRNLIEQPEKIIKSSSRLMMLSESGRLLDSELKPSNKSNKDPKAVPQNAFTNTKLHGNGSHILFADGHVKLFNAEAYFYKGCEWDPKTKRWFSVGDKKTLNAHSIQITP
jgi:prepilin-type processing-associated H-X9-DG protein